MRSLYLKILMHGMAALVITEALIFGLFVLVAGDSHSQYLITSVGQSTLVARDYVQDSVAAEISRGAKPADALAAALRRLGASSNAKVWITGPGGGLVAASFPGVPPAPAVNYRKSGQYAGVTVALDSRKRLPWYATVPVALSFQDQPLLLHLLSQHVTDPFPSGGFAAGLALIGVLIALLAVPLSLRITKPLHRLKLSALRIAGGDLSARADVTQRDEIGELALAFNTMADTVERMVRGGKELTANISHELRSPLARMRVAGECLKDALDRGERQEVDEMLGAIWEEIEEADQMIANILEFSKLDLHEPLLAAREVVPADLIAGLVKSVGPLAKSKSIRFDLDLLPGQQVTGDAAWLRTALKNLLENAVRHTAGGGEVRVVMRRQEALLVVEVTNTHPPLEDAELELIFKPFYRGKGSSGEGTGLGLAIAGKIVALHGGEIGAQNTPEGFQVRIALPLAKA
jgi:signal transduction histidine kinase